VTSLVPVDGPCSSHKGLRYCATLEISDALKPSDLRRLQVVTTASSVGALPLWKYGGCCQTPRNGAVRCCLVALARYFGVVNAGCCDPGARDSANFALAASIAGRCAIAQPWRTCSGTISVRPSSVSS